MKRSSSRQRGTRRPRDSSGCAPCDTLRTAWRSESVRLVELTCAQANTAAAPLAWNPAAGGSIAGSSSDDVADACGSQSLRVRVLASWSGRERTAVVNRDTPLAVALDDICVQCGVRPTDAVRVVCRGKELDPAQHAVPIGAVVPDGATLLLLAPRV